jgi:cytochrome c oxidase subunit II
MGRKRWLSWEAVLPAFALLLAACAPDAPQDTLDPAGPVAREQNALFLLVFWIAVGVFVLVEGLIVVAMVRFRHRPGRPVPIQVHGNKRLELGWTIAPAVLLGAIAVPTLATIFSLSGRPSGDVLDVKVEAHQFWWHTEYPELGVTTANEVHVPVGRPVFVQLRSVDVIHSFWVPRLAGTQDVQPGFPTTMRFEAETPGTYLGQCKEYCGLSHANMRFRVIAQTPAEFDAWVEAQRAEAAPPGDDVLSILQEAGCGGCHTLRGVEGFVGTIGPDLTHFGSRQTFGGAMFRNDPEKLSAWLRDPEALKPGNDMKLPRDLTEEEIRALVAYLESLE